MKDPRLTKLETEWDSNYAQIEALKVRAAENEDGTLDDADNAEYETLVTRAAELKPQIEKLRKQDELLNSVAAGNKIAAVQEDQKVRANETTTFGDVAFHFIRGNIYGDPRSTQLANRALSRSLDVYDSSSSTGADPEITLPGIIRFVDAKRHLIDSLTYNSCPNGANDFHVLIETAAANGPMVGTQSSENAEVSSGFPTISRATVSHSTYAGGVRLTLQALNHNTPDGRSVWARSAAEQYAIVTDTAVATAFKSAATNTSALAGVETDPDYVLNGIGTAVDLVYTNSKSTADTIWVDVTVGRILKNLRDTTKRPLFSTIGPSNAAGSNSSSATFSTFSIEGLPVVVCPNFSGGTFIVGNSAYGNVFESRYPEMSAAQPSTGSVEYSIWGELGTYFRAEGFVKILTSDATPNWS